MKRFSECVEYHTKCISIALKLVVWLKIEQYLYIFASSTHIHNYYSWKIKSIILCNIKKKTLKYMNHDDETSIETFLIISHLENSLKLKKRYFITEYFS